MPFDSNGNASLVPSYFVQDGDDVLPVQHNPPLEDIASMLSQTLLRNGAAPLSGNLNANGNKVTNLAAPTNPNDAARLADIRDRPRFLANKNGVNQALPNADTIVTFGTEVTDVGGIYDPATSRFTPPAGRTFIVYAQFLVNITSGNRRVECQLLKNGTTVVARGISHNEDNRPNLPNVTFMVVGNGTDYYEIRVNALVSTAYAVDGGTDKSYFMAYEI